MSTNLSIARIEDHLPINLSRLNLSESSPSQKWEQFIIDGNVTTLKEARVKVLLESHRNETVRASNAKIIDEHYQEGDTIFTEYWANTPSSKILYTPQTYMKRKNVKIEGWLCPKAQKIYNEWHKNKIKPLQEENRAIVAQLSSLRLDDLNDFYSIDCQAKQLNQQRQKIRENIKPLLRQITNQLFSQNQNFLIELINQWLQENFSTSHCLYIVMGRHHGNQYLEHPEEESFKSEEASRLIKVLESKTTFVIIDQHGKSP